MGLPADKCTLRVFSLASYASSILRWRSSCIHSILSDLADTQWQVEQGQCKEVCTRCWMIVSSCSVKLLDSSCWKRSSVLHKAVSQQPNPIGIRLANVYHDLLMCANGLIALVKHPSQVHCVTWFCVLFTTVHCSDNTMEIARRFAFKQELQ